MKPLLTIVVPVRNMAEKLGHLKSWIEKATFVNLEIIVVEDKDDLRTSLELTEFVTVLNSPNVRLISGNFGGPGLSRNAGKDIANGTWVAFWDADDKGYPEVALKALAELDKISNVNLLIFSFDVRDWATEEMLSEKRLDSKKSSINTILEYPGIWRMCFRTDLLTGVTFPSYQMAEDQVFLARVINKAPNIEFFDQKVYSYYKNVPGQLTKSERAISDLVHSARDMSSFIEASPSNQFFLELFVRQCLSGIKHGKQKERVTFMLMIVKFLFFKPSLLRGKVVLRVIFS